MRSRALELIVGASLMLLAQLAHALLPIQHWETQRGARVYFVENHDLPTLTSSIGRS